MARKRQRSRRPASRMVPPSTSEEDYLEVIYRLEQNAGPILLSEIAERLGVQRPPATRAIQALRRKGFVEHEARREVHLTDLGRSVAQALAHRHEDVFYLLTAVLGIPRDVAEADTCQMEHGVSPLTAQRLHEFLEHYKALDREARQRLKPGRSTAAFRHLPKGRGAGWRA